jgi:DNA invertase Pin-like site-specific DNA recombinase
MGKMLVTILTAVAEAERLRILERTNEGRLEAKAKGIKFGRKRQIDRGLVRKLRAEGVSCIHIAQQLRISRAMVYRICGEI